MEEAKEAQRKQGSECCGMGGDGAVLSKFRRVRLRGGSEVDGGAACQCVVCVLCKFVSSPQPALVRVAARGQPSGRLASGGGADGGEEAARAEAEEVERTVERGVLVDRCEDGLVRGALSARARPRRPLD